MKRFLDAVPHRWRLEMIIDNDNIVICHTVSYRKAILNIVTKENRLITQDEFKAMKAKRLAENPNRKAEIIAAKVEKMAELEKQLEKLRKEIEELQRG